MNTTAPTHRLDASPLVTHPDRKGGVEIAPVVANRQRHPEALAPRASVLRAQRRWSSRASPTAGRLLDPSLTVGVRRALAYHPDLRESCMTATKSMDAI